MGEEFVKDYDLSSLRVLGSVGEPINPEVSFCSACVSCRADEAGLALVQVSLAWVVERDSG